MSRLEGLQRVVALLPMHGAAAGWIDARSASVWPRPPRSPRSRKAPPKDGGQPARGAFWHRFSLSLGSVARAGGAIPWKTAWVRGLTSTPMRAAGRSAKPAFPRVASVSPRVASIFPRVCFLRSGALSLSSLSFYRGRRKRKGGRRGRGRHPRVENVRRGYKAYGSWKKRAFHGFSVDGCEPEVQCFQWVTGGGRRSTGFSVEMPLSPRVVVPAGGLDGVR